MKISTRSSVFFSLFLLFSLSEANFDVPKWGSKGVKRVSADYKQLTSRNTTIYSKEADLEIGKGGLSLFVQTTTISASGPKYNPSTKQNDYPQISYHADSGSFTISKKTGVLAFSGVDITFMPLFLWEYYETNGQIGLQLTEPQDYIFSIVRLVDLPWNQPQLVKNKTSDGVDYYVLSCETQNGVFGFRLSVAEADLNLENNNISADSIKIDMWIRYYDGAVPSASNDPNARVSLTAQLITKTNSTTFNFVQKKGNRTSASVAESNGSAVGFSWALDAETNNGIVDVLGVESQSYDFTKNGTRFQYRYSNFSEARQLIFSFLDRRPEYIYWDPQMGVVDTTTMVNAPPQQQTQSPTTSPVPSKETSSPQNDPSLGGDTSEAPTPNSSASSDGLKEASTKTSSSSILTSASIFTLLVCLLAL